MKKKIIFGMLVVSHDNDYDRFLKINLDIYKKIFSEFGNFHIINMSNLTLSPYKREKSVNKKFFFSKKIKVFKPNNELDFINFFEDKTFVAFNNLGKSLSNFKIFYYLNKIDLKQILLMNYGHINNAIEIFKNNDVNYSNITGIVYFLKRKFTNYLFRALILFNIFPKIDIYFESSNAIFESTYKKNIFRKKLEKFLPFEINFFRNIFKINSRSFDNFKKRKKLSSKYICFIDSNIDNLDVALREGKISISNKKIYYKKLNKLFSDLKIIFKKKIIICLHPKNVDKMIKRSFRNYKIVKYKTPEIINNSYLILFHDSSAALDAILLEKNILCIKSEILGNYWNDRIDQYVNKLNLPIINIDKIYDINKSKLLKKISVSKKNLRKYAKENLQIDNNNIGQDKVIKVIKKFI